MSYTQSKVALQTMPQKRQRSLLAGTLLSLSALYLFPKQTLVNFVPTCTSNFVSTLRVRPRYLDEDRLQKVTLYAKKPVDLEREKKRQEAARLREEATKKAALAREEAKKAPPKEAEKPQTSHTAEALAELKESEEADTAEEEESSPVEAEEEEIEEAAPVKAKKAVGDKAPVKATEITKASAKTQKEEIEEAAPVKAKKAAGDKAPVKARETTKASAKTQKASIETKSAPAAKTRASKKVASSDAKLPTVEEAKKMKVVELKDVLRNAGLTVSGLKADLLARVLQHIGES